MELFRSLACLLSVKFILGELMSTVEACGTTLTSPSGQIISKGYPTGYPNNLSCQWYMIAPSGQVIEITFLDVDLEERDSNEECLDSVSVYDGSVNSRLLSSPFCEDGPGWPRHPTRMLSTSNHMTVVMETNGAVTGRGISANYKHVSPRKEMIAGVDTDNLEIFYFNRVGRTSPGKLPLTGASSPSAISFDPVEEYFYFTETGVKAFIGRVNFRGSKVDVLIDHGLQEPLGLTVGYMTGLLYWTDSNKSEVSVSRLDGKFRKTVVSTNTGCVSPKDILLGPNEENVYWTCRGRIETSKADGSGREIFVNSSVLDPRSLALDSETMTLFWTDAGTQTLWSISLDGSIRRKLGEASVFSQMNGFTIDSHAFIWANPLKRRLQLIGRNTPLPATFHDLWRDPPSRVEGIYYYNSAREIQEPSVCRTSNDGCQELCFMDGIAIICEDVTPGIVGCPENIVKLTEGPEAVNWSEPSAISRSSTESPPLPIESQSHKPNDQFPLGTTTVTYTFRDENGNTNKCLFNVTLVTEGEVQISTYILIATLAAGLLFLIPLLIGLMMWYRCLHGKDKDNDKEGQEGYSTAVDDYEAYYTIPDTPVGPNDHGLHNDAAGNDGRCHEGYATRNHLSYNSMSSSHYNQRSLVGYTTRIERDSSISLTYTTKIFGTSSGNSGTDVTT